MAFIKKILGLALLFGGLSVIFYGLYSSYDIFTGKKEAPAIFDEAEQSVSKTSLQDPQAQLQEMIGEQLKGLLPADSVPNLLNLFSWSIFAGILVLGGGQISGIGIKLLR